MSWIMAGRSSPAIGVGGRTVAPSGPITDLVRKGASNWSQNTTISPVAGSTLGCAVMPIGMVPQKVSRPRVASSADIRKGFAASASASIRPPCRTTLIPGRSFMVPARSGPTRSLPGR